MKKVFLVLAAMFFAFTVSAQAPAGGQGGGQGGGGGMRGGGTPEQQIARLETSTTGGTVITGLTADQKTKLTAVYTEAATLRTAAMDKLTAAAAGGQVDRAERTKVTDALTAAADVKVLAILTDAQKAQYKKIQEERAARMAQGGGQRGGGGGAPAGGGMAPAN